MRPTRPTILIALTLLFAACGVGAKGTDTHLLTDGKWTGSDIHLVDGTWIGTEAPCLQGGAFLAVSCRTILERTMEALPSDLRVKVTKAVRADLPTTFVTTPWGETRTALLSAGIATREAVVFDLVDGTRRVIGLWCYLPSSGDGVFEAATAKCEISPLDFWRDGNAPPPIPPGSATG